MAEKYVIVPQSELDAVEAARVELYELMTELGYGLTDYAMMRLTNITYPIWHVANRKYPEVSDMLPTNGD